MEKTNKYTDSEAGSQEVVGENGHADHLPPILIDHPAILKIKEVRR